MTCQVDAKKYDYKRVNYPEVGAVFCNGVEVKIINQPGSNNNTN
jgi:hypothetical protein